MSCSSQGSSSTQIAASVLALAASRGAVAVVIRKRSSRPQRDLVDGGRRHRIGAAAVVLMEGDCNGVGAGAGAQQAQGQSRGFFAARVRLVRRWLCDLDRPQAAGGNSP